MPLDKNKWKPVGQTQQQGGEFTPQNPEFRPGVTPLPQRQTTTPQNMPQPQQSGGGFIGWMKKGGFLPQLEQFGIGALKGVGSTVRGTLALSEKGLQSVTGGQTGTTAAEEFIPKSAVTPQGTAQTAGFMTEQIGEFFIPASASLKVGKAAQFATKGGRAAQTAAKIGAIGATEGVLGTLQSGMQSGKIGKGELQVGGVSLFAPVALAGAGKVLSKAIPAPVKTQLSEAISKAIRPSTKSVKTPGYMDSFIRGFKVMKQDLEALGKEAPDTVGATLDALKSAKKNVYEEYNAIAQRTGELGARYNPGKVVKDLSDWLNSTGYSRDIKNHAAKRLDELQDLMGASPKQIQDRIEELNSSINWGSVGEKMKASIDASIARRLRLNLDEMILNSTGEPYQFLRGNYAALRAMEEDIARRAAVIARKNERGLIDFSDIWTGGDILAGAITGSPLNVVKGLTGQALKNYTKYINSPERNLEKIWKLIDDVPLERPATIPIRQLPAGVRGGASEVIENAPMSVPPKLQSTIDALDISRAEKDKLIRELQGVVSPGNQSLLPPGTGATTPIPLGSRTQSTIDAEELQRLQSLKGSGATTPKTVGEDYKTLYHVTTPEVAIEINKTGVPKIDGDNAFFAWKTREEAEQWAKISGNKNTIVEVKAKPWNIEDAKDRMSIVAKGDDGEPIYDVVFSEDDFLPKIIQEARKYKSAEEFVKAQTPMAQFTDEGKVGKFWTTPEGADEGFGSIRREAFIDKSKLYKGVSSRDFLEERGLMTKELEAKLERALESDNPNMEFKITQDLAEDILKKEGKPGAWWTYEDDLNPTQYQIWDNSIIKTKSQLIDIWNKANK